jgi:hypothetical protein
LSQCGGVTPPAAPWPLPSPPRAVAGVSSSAPPPAPLGASQRRPERAINRPSRLNRFRTVVACRFPPRAVRTPLAFNAAAMARCPLGSGSV